MANSSALSTNKAHPLRWSFELHLFQRVPRLAAYSERAVRGPKNDLVVLSPGAAGNFPRMFPKDRYLLSRVLVVHQDVALGGAHHQLRADRRPRHEGGILEVGVDAEGHPRGGIPYRDDSDALLQHSKTFAIDVPV